MAFVLNRKKKKVETKEKGKESISALLTPTATKPVRGFVL